MSADVTTANPNHDISPDSTVDFDNATIDPSAKLRIRTGGALIGSNVIGENCTVYLSGTGSLARSRLLPRASVEVYGDASVSNCYLEHRAYLSATDASYVTGARIRHSVSIMNHATISLGADLAHPRHYLTMGPVGSEHRTVTAYRVLGKEGDDYAWGAMVSAGCFRGTLAQLRDRIEDPGEAWPYKEAEQIAAAQADYRGFITMTDARVAEWQQHPPTEADVEFWTKRRENGTFR